MCTNVTNTHAFCTYTGVIGKCAYHMAKCKEKIPNYRSSLILCVVIEELRVVKGLVAYGLGSPKRVFSFFFSLCTNVTNTHAFCTYTSVIGKCAYHMAKCVYKCHKYACVLYVHGCDR